MKEFRQLLNRGISAGQREGEGKRTVRVEVKKPESPPTKSDGIWRTKAPLGLCRMYMGRDCGLVLGIACWF